VLNQAHDFHNLLEALCMNTRIIALHAILIIDFQNLNVMNFMQENVESFESVLGDTETEEFPSVIRSLYFPSTQKRQFFNKKEIRHLQPLQQLFW